MRHGTRPQRKSCVKLTFFDILRYAVRFAIVVVMIFLFTGAEGRREIKGHYHWQPNNTAYGKSEISEDCQSPNNEPNLAINLFMTANFSGSYLESKDLSMKAFVMTMFSGGHLKEVSFSHSAFVITDFSGAHLRDADLSGAVFVLTNFSGAYLEGANLSGTIFRLANFAGANFRNVNLDRADLAFANLKGINNWREIRSIRNANIYKVRNYPEGFIEWALENGAVSISPSEQWQNSRRKEL